MQFVDKPFGSDVPIVSPENAFMSGALKTDNLDDLRRFERSFPLNPHVIMAKAIEMREVYQKRGALPSDKEKMDILFVELVPKVFVAANAAGWNAVFHFKIEAAGDYTVTVKNGAASSVAGLVGTPTCTVTSHYETWRKLLRYELLEDSGQVPINKLQTWQDEESIDKELSDEMLEAVAGGKGGGCGAEASAGTACGKDACGAAAGAGGACGAAACAAAAGVGGVCGAAACGADACAGAACGAAACGAAACGAAGCGADAGVGACAGNVCGAAVGAGVCAGNACGVDVLGGADIGPCAVNVIPCVPGC